MKNRNIKLPISKQIDVSYRGYALYVLENRGIPSFYDGLTNVQRIILTSASTTFEKTPSLIGSCFRAGYHHGDASLSNAINKLAREYSNSTNLLKGDGFFGNPINTTAAASRYTNVKIVNQIKDIISSNSFLNREVDGVLQPLWVDIPIGITTQIIGIAIGYKTVILPRKLDDVKKFLNGEKKYIKPYFQNFTGKVTKSKQKEKSWLIEGVTEINEFMQSITVTDLPPLMKYNSFLKKLENIIEKQSANVSITNDSTTKIKIKIKLRGQKKEWAKFRDSVIKITKMIVTENPVFIKDGSVVEYDRLEDYLIDFKFRVSELELKRSIYFMEKDTNELDFNISKKKYLKYMLATKHTDDEIEHFINNFTDKISKRLNQILLKNLTSNELTRVGEIIDTLRSDIKKAKSDIKTLSANFNKLEDTANFRKVKKSNKTTDLFADTPTEIDGVEVYMNDITTEEPNDDIVF